MAKKLKKVISDRSSLSYVCNSGRQIVGCLAILNLLLVVLAYSHIERSVLFVWHSTFHVLHKPSKNYHQRAIIYLVNNRTQEIENTKRSLHLLIANFPNIRKYQILLFHEGNIAESVMRQVVNNATQLQIRFEFVDFSRHPIDPANITTAKKYGIGYRHMCHFWFKVVFEHPAVRHLQYYMRLDTDSYITEKVVEDPFERMAASNKKYGYIYMRRDGASLTWGLPTFIRRFIQKQSNMMAARNQYSPKNKEPWVYYNNFEIVHVPTFINNQCIQQFVQEVESSGYIFTRRWGDAPLRYATVNMCLLVEKDVMRFCDIEYYHRATLYPCNAKT